MAVAKLSRQQREAGRDHEQAKAVGVAIRVRDRTGADECDTDDDNRQGSCRRRQAAEIVDLDAVGEERERDSRSDQGDPDVSHADSSSCRSESPERWSFGMKPKAPLCR